MEPSCRCRSTGQMTLSPDALNRGGLQSPAMNADADAVDASRLRPRPEEPSANRPSDGDDNDDDQTSLRRRRVPRDVASEGPSGPRPEGPDYEPPAKRGAKYPARPSSRAALTSTAGPDTSATMRPSPRSPAPPTSARVERISQALCVREDARRRRRPSDPAFRPRRMGRRLQQAALRNQTRKSF